MTKSITIGTRVFINNPDHSRYLMAGKVIALYDPRHFKRELTVKSFRDSDTTFGCQFEDCRVIDDGLPFSSRGNLYRAIKRGQIQGQEIVDLLRRMRDLGLLEIKLPAEIN